MDNNFVIVQAKIIPELDRIVVLYTDRVEVRNEFDSSLAGSRITDPQITGPLKVIQPTLLGMEYDTDLDYIILYSSDIRYNLMVWKYKTDERISMLIHSNKVNGI